MLPSRRLLRGRLIALGAAATLLAAWLALPSAPATAATTCALVPQLRDVSVSQGVGSYPVLVRGKQGLARFYLSLPSCASASASIKVTGATLAVSSSATTVPAVTAYSPTASTTPPSLVPYAAAPALDAAADPKFVVPALVSASTTARFGITLSAKVSYSAQASSGSTAVTGTATFATRPGTTTPISLTVEKKTNALRVLVVPMGDATKAYDVQFDATTKATTQNGMTALGRKLPVPDGTGDLTTTTSAGLRYTINPTLLDLSGLLSSGVFCGTGSNFDTIKGQLATFRQSWNTANPLQPADRVLGVVKDSLSKGGSNGCAEGMAAINGAEAWVRADTTHSPSMTGSLMAMELGHTMGLVPATRADPYSPYHSAYVQADGTAPNRAYNVGLRSFLADDHTALDLAGTTWNDTDTLYEKDDWTTLLCALGGATTTECTVSGTVGTAVGVGAEPTFVLSGTTDDTADGTKVVESYFANGVPRTLPDAASTYRLVQLRGSQVLRDDGVPVTFATSAHSDIGSPAPTTGLFSSAFPFDTAANRIELRNGTTVLYSRERGQRPVLTSTAATSGGSTPPPSGTTVQRANVSTAGVQSAGPSYNADLSDSGTVVTFDSDATDIVAPDTNGTTDVFVRDLALGTTERISNAYNGGQANGASITPHLSANGRYVAFTSSADNLVPGDVNGYRDVFVRDRTNGTTELISLDSSGAQANNYSYGDPKLSSDGRFVLFASRASNLAVDATPYGNMYLRDRVLGTTKTVDVPMTGGTYGGSQLPGDITADGSIAAFTSLDRLVSNDVTCCMDFDTYVRDFSSASNELVSAADSTDEHGNAPSFGAAMDTTGNRVLFSSDATNLIGPSADLGGHRDVFLRDRAAHSTTLVSRSSTGVQGNGDSDLIGASPDLRFVLFSSTASNLVPGDVNLAGDVFLLDTTTNAVTLISTAADGTQGDLTSSGRGGVSSDGALQAYTSNANNLVANDTNSQTDMFVRSAAASSPPPPPSPPAGTVDVSVSATDDNPVDLRLDLVYTCGSTGYPVEVGVKPTDTTTTSASWSLHADTSLACQGGTLSAVVNDGFSQAAPLAAGEVASGSTAKAPVAAISGPVTGTTLLQFDPVTLGGSGKDPESGELTGSSLDWTVLGPDGTTVASGSGSVVDIPPPADGWTPGTYTVRLVTTDGDGTKDTATTSFTVASDADHDNMSSSVESQPCFPAGADSDPTNAYADQDADGIPNADDVVLTGKPCVAATSYSASFTVSPDPIPLTSVSGQVVTATVRLPYRDLASVAPASVRLTQIAGKDVTGFGNLGWSVVGSTATAKFDRGALVRYLSARNLLRRPVTLTLSGRASSGTWSFSGIGSVSTK